MNENEAIGPHAEFETRLNFVNIYDKSVRALLSRDSSEPGIHYHLGIVQVALALEALVSRIYLEFVYPDLPTTAREGLERHPAESRWYLAPVLIQTLRGRRPTYFDKGKMPFQGLAELIKFRNTSVHPVPDFVMTGKDERPFISDGDPGDHLPRRTFWDRKEWPHLRIHMHPECVTRDELRRSYDLFLSLISELGNMTENLISFEWATMPVFTIKALVA